MQNDKNIANLESRIGLYWLHRLGIVTLVFGIVFLITYSIQLSTNPLLMPLFKLTIGMAVSMILLLLGKRMSVKEKEQWYHQDDNRKESGVESQNSPQVEAFESNIP